MGKGRLGQTSPPHHRLRRFFCSTSGHLPYNPLELLLKLSKSINVQNTLTLEPLLLAMWGGGTKARPEHSGRKQG